MSTHTSPTLIGTFVAGAIGLIVAGILIISGGKLLLTDKSSYVLYFHGSVKGLNIGSPVSFRGVNIGTVTDIQLVVGEIKESCDGLHGSSFLVDCKIRKAAGILQQDSQSRTFLFGKVSRNADAGVPVGWYSLCVFRQVTGRAPIPSKTCQRRIW